MQRRPSGRRFDPDPARHETYREMLARQRRLYEAVLERNVE